SDPNLRSAWLKAGNQPYSVKLPWSDTWVPINKIPLLPLRGALTFDAAVNDVKLNNGDGNVAAKFARSYGRALADDAFLPQLIQMGVALQKGDDSGVPSTVAGTVRMLLPMESRLMAKAESTVKPDVSGKPYRPAGAGLAEKVGSAVQAQVLANTPRGLGQPAPQPALTNTGQTEPNVQNGLSVLSPLAPTRPSYDPVQEAFGRIGVPLSTPPTSITSNSKTIQLTGAEQQQYLRVRGQFLAENVPDGGFDSVEQAQRLLQKADEHAAKEVKPTGDEFDQRAVSTKDARQQQAQQRSDAWSQALGVPLAAASARPTPTAPSASRAAAGAVSDAWAKALGK
ncbi:MAG TPA: hypothetical protein VFB90_01105, partial [Dehalococcoidia bacterium]|nr:hypothetical protein [Dehalococcoidia bacterium]